MSAPAGVRDTLREKLEKLVEEWREDIKHVLMSAEDYSPRDYAECRAIKGCADQLAAILAESEEPCCRWKAERETQPSTKAWGLSGHLRVHPKPNPGQTHYVGDDCPGGHAEDPVARMLDAGITPEMSYPKAKLPLGHSFMAAVDVLGRKSKSSGEFCALCGQPRSAHESK